MHKILSRLFLPVLSNRLSSLKLIIESSLEAIWFDIIPLFSIPFIIGLIQAKKYDEFLSFSLIILAVYLAIWFVHVFIRVWDAEAKYKYLTWIEQTYRKKLILKENMAMDILGTGKVQSLVQKGMTDWVECVWQILYQIPKVVLTVATGIFILKDFGLLFLLFFLLYAVISSIGYTYFRKRKLKYDKKINEIEDEKNAHSVRVIMSRQEIIFSGKENVEVKQLAGYANKQYEVSKITAKYDFISDWFISGVGTVLPFLGAIYVLTSSLKNSIEIGAFVSFVYFTSRFAFSMYSMLWIVRQSLEFMPKIQKFWDFLDYIPEMKNYDKGEKFVHGNGTVQFKNVTFKYDQELLKTSLFEKKEDETEGEVTEEDIVKDKVILENFNLNISGGSTLALVGLSGSGKTTIAKLIAGYLQTTGGQILVDGQDLSKLSLKSYYKYIGYLTQEPMVFDGTIKENLLYSVPETFVSSTKKVSNTSQQEEKIIEALRKANCDFVFGMKKGINTQIGEKGIRLSGGERQRLAIAKLFLKDPEIIILDEPTSALDSFSEDKISKSLEELFKGRTTIIIAHRLQTVKKADRILVIENGEIVEDGNHEELNNLNGVYSKMLAMQSGF